MAFFQLFLVFLFFSLFAENSTEKVPIDQLNPAQVFSLVTQGRYEEYLQYLKNSSETIPWEDFLSIQSQVKGVLSQETGIPNQKACIDQVLIFFSDYPGVSTQPVDSLWNQFIFIHPEWNQESTQLYFFVLWELLQLNLFEICSICPVKVEKIYFLIKEVKRPILDLAFFTYTLMTIPQPDITRYQGLHYFFLIERLKELFIEKNERIPAHIYLKMMELYSKKLHYAMDSPIDSVLTKIAFILEIYDLEEGRILKEHFLKLPETDLSLVLEEFGFYNHHLDRTFPKNLRVFLQRSQFEPLFGEERAERIRNIMQAAVPFIAKILRHQRFMVNRNELKLDEDLNFCEQQRKYAQDPKLLKSCSFHLQKNGSIVFDH